jgi:2'-5' RNA ligase
MERHLFLAVQLPVQVKKKLEEITGRLEKTVSFNTWVHPEDYHITLAFLGKAEQDQLHRLFPLLKEAVTNHSVFPLTIDHFGFFGKSDRPRIFWAGLEKQLSLFELQKKIADACIQAGFSLEKRPYSPHITISRKLVESEDLPIDHNVWWNKFGEPISFQAERIVVYETHFEKTPKYEIIQSFSLVLI